MPAHTTPSTVAAAASYAAQVDNSTPATRYETLTRVATRARTDAAALQEEADSYRLAAAGMDDKVGMGDVAEDMRREAARMEEDSRSRLSMAAAFDDAASNSAAATG